MNFEKLVLSNEGTWFRAWGLSRLAGISVGCRVCERRTWELALEV